MTLSDCRFTYSGWDARFSVFSDLPTVTRLIDSVLEPLSKQPIEIYRIETQPDAKWVAVIVSLQGQDKLRGFVRKGFEFHEVSESMLDPISRRVDAIRHRKRAA